MPLSRLKPAQKDAPLSSTIKRERAPFVATPPVSPKLTAAQRLDKFTQSLNARDLTRAPRQRQRMLLDAITGVPPEASVAPNAPAPMHRVAERQALKARMRPVFTELRDNKPVLHKEGTVIWLAHGTHGVVYARSHRVNRGAPILGRIYSGFLFDPYRRPYAFGGSPSAIARGWYNRLIDARVQKVQPMIDALENAGKWQDAVAVRDGLFAVTRGSSYALACREGLQKALKISKKEKIVFACIDLFLRDITTKVLPLFPADEQQLHSAHAMVLDCWDDFVRANRAAGLQGRELWPIADTDSWRVADDQLWVLGADNTALTGEPTAFQRDEVTPDMPTPLPRTAREEAALMHISMALKKVQRTIPQDISHQALRMALREFHVAKILFDEKMGRNAAVNALHATNVPSNENAKAMVKKYFSTYKMLPFRKALQRGNCNSIIVTLLERAAEIDEDLGNGKPEVKRPGWRAGYGAAHAVRLPIGRVRNDL